MKEVVSVSLGSSTRNHRIRIRVCGEMVRIVRIGTDGDIRKAKNWIRRLDGRADAIGLGEHRKLDNLLRFEDFIKEDNQKVSKKSVKKVKTAKDYNEAVKDGYVKLREDYIHSLIDQHEPDHDLPEEE